MTNEIINIILLSYLLILSNKSFKTVVLSIGASIGIPVLISSIWNIHVQQTFPSGLNSKHSMSFSNYESIFAGKSPNDIQNIISIFFENMLDLKDVINQILLFLLMVLVLAFIVKIVISKKVSIRFIEFKLIASYIVIYIFYQVGLLGMYLLSMPVNEALILAGYDRYNATIVIYLYGIILLYLLKVIQYFKFKDRKFQVTKVIIIIMIVFLPLSMRDRGLNIINLMTLHQEELPVRNRLTNIVENQVFKESSNFYIYISDNGLLNQAGILRYISRYELRSENVEVIGKSSLKESSLKKDGYLIVLEEDPIILKFINRNNLELISNSIVSLEGLE